MTNKEKFKEIFGIEPDCGRCNPYPCEENDCKYWAECENQPGCPCDNWWEWEFEEATTKNDLGVDAVSREQALKELKESAEHHANDSREEVLLRRDRDIIRALPSVTPQNQVYPLCEDCHTKMDEVRRAYDNAMKQEPILDKIRAEILEEMLPHSGTGEEVIQAYADGLKKGLDILDKYRK